MSTSWAAESTAKAQTLSNVLKHLDTLQTGNKACFLVPAMTASLVEEMLRLHIAHSHHDGTSKHKQQSPLCHQRGLRKAQDCGANAAVLPTYSLTLVHVIWKASHIDL